MFRSWMKILPYFVLKRIAKKLSPCTNIGSSNFLEMSFDKENKIYFYVSKEFVENRYNKYNTKLLEDIKVFVHERVDSYEKLIKVYWFPDPKNQFVRLLYVQLDCTPNTLPIHFFEFDFNEKMKFVVGTTSLREVNKKGLKKIIPKVWGNPKNNVIIWEKV